MPGKIISIISNKGGVGKTLFAIETANILGALGNDVLLIDTDINTGDVAIKLDLRLDSTLLDFFERSESDLSNLIIEKFNFDLIPGSGGNFKFANLNYFQKMKFIKAFKEISQDYDYTILDLGAGIERTTLDFGLAADYPIIITTPEDIQSGYGCAKAAAVRLQELNEKLLQKDPAMIIRERFEPKFVFNKSTTQLAENIFNGIKRATEITRQRENIAIYPDLIGAVPEEYRLVSKAYLRQHTPISELFPGSRISQAYRSIALNITRHDDENQLDKKTTPLEKIIKLFRYEQEKSSLVETA
ncbi:MAG: AAA family ATPase [Candidatus Neomarinimicrobiota bacterium]